MRRPRDPTKKSVSSSQRSDLSLWQASPVGSASNICNLSGSTARGEARDDSDVIAAWALVAHIRIQELEIKHNHYESDT
jgi:hypothetical protein